MAEVNVDIQEEKRISAKTLFKNKSFVALFFAALFSAPGYYMYLIGVEWLMLTIHDDRSVFGMLFFAASIPRLIFLTRSEEHTSELQSRGHLVCRLLLEYKNVIYDIQS